VTTTLPARNPDAALAILWEQEQHDAGELVAAARSESTIAGYADDWAKFGDWHRERGLGDPLPPVDHRAVLLWLTDIHLEVKASTIARRLSGIRYAHHLAGVPSPTDHPQVRQALAGVRRIRQDRPRQARPLYLDDLTAAVETLGGSARERRDRALLLVGWWGAFRRSELVGIDAAHITDHPQGVAVELPKSKTDQEGAGRMVPLHYRQREDLCPVRALREWANGTPGPVFRRVDRWGNVRATRLGAAAVNVVVKEAAERVGLDPAHYSAHSLRAGFVSECDRRGIGSSAVRVVTGHQSDAMLATYTRPRSLFESSAGAMFEE